MPTIKKSHVEYSDYTNSNWYSYWLAGFNGLKINQILFYSFIGEVDYCLIDYSTALKALKNTNLAIPKDLKLEENDKQKLADIINSFVDDMNSRFGS